ncbi:MAG: HAMP domain-containing histidine kinase [Sulfurospirillum sp.]|nr:HAMP domain-containing histidine kinase [Sulfurospirillum sp.]
MINKLLYFIFSLSVRIKLAVLIFFVVLSISSVSILINIDMHKNNSAILIDELIRTNINSNKAFIGQFVLARDNWELYKFLKTLSASEMIKSAGFVDNLNRVLAHTDTKKFRINDTMANFKNLFVVPFKQDDVEFGSFVLEVEQQSFFDLIKESFLIQMALFIIVALLSFLIANIFMGKLLARLDLLTNNAQAIIEKKWSHVMYYNGWENDEITDLIHSTTKFMQDMRTAIEKEEKNTNILQSLTILSNISASFAHEIKNLMQPLKLLIPKDTPPDKEDMSLIHNALMRIDHQVMDFLALARPIDIIKDEPLHVSIFVKESVALLRPKCTEKKLQIKTFIQDNFMAKLNPKAIELILINLLNNAIDASYKHSIIELRWGQYDQNLSLLSVQNHGMNMDTRTKENLFKPFFTTKKDGSDLGLFSIYKIIYLGGGYIEFISENEITTFYLYIPLREKK